MQHGRIVMQMRTMIRALALLFGLALVPSAMAQVDARLIVKFRDGATKSALTPQARTAKLALAVGAPMMHLREMALGADVVVASVPTRGDAERLAERLAANPAIEFALVDRRRQPAQAAQAAPINDEFAGGQTYLTNGAGAISAFSAWDVTHGSSAIVVAILDTGYRPHAAMAGRILPGYDMIGDPKTANDGSGRDADALDPGDWVPASDATADCPAHNSSWHGTGVAGIVGANTNDGIWTAGIDWAAKILPVRVLGRCGGYDSDIIDAIAWAAGLAVPGAPVNPTPAQVINLSLGGDHPCPAIYPAVINAAYAYGRTRAIVAAAGNEADDVANHAPANCPGVIAVASTIVISGSLARYSNFGTGVTFSAPGGMPTQGALVLSNTGTTTPLDDGFAREGGTSFSAPMVAGTISLMLSVAPTLTPDQVVSILTSTAKPFPAGSDCTTDRCGAGIVDAGAAVRAAAQVAAGGVNYEGLWWKSPAGSESGWGMNVAQQGDVIFATWFTYDATGKAWWLSMTANASAPNVFSGTLYRTNGPAFSVVPFNPANVTATAVGNGTLAFSDANNGTFAYTVNGVSQTKAITRQVFGPLPACTFGAQSDLSFATNYQDLWWAAPAGAESGWGVNFTQQGATIFATWFTYDFDGSPLWLSATLTPAAANAFGGTLYRTTGPPFSAVPFDPNRVTLASVGTLTLTFANGNAATFAYTVNGVSQAKSITRQVFRSPGTVCR
jgi:serine protease